jgi:hypothetical protein
MWDYPTVFVPPSRQTDAVATALPDRTGKAYAFRVMKTSTTIKPLTLGDLVVSVYDEWGNAKAPVVLRRAVNSRCVKVSGIKQFVID